MNNESEQPTFNKILKLVIGYILPIYVYFQSEQQREQILVHLVETTRYVFEHVKSLQRKRIA